ncbi:MAG TPA: tetratricopeptide repeat protein [Wenzhouxiangellaceae bacterium]|nr:tetratricopeptide repeat protein [Wenzhouxiangellaceae bacterium]
MTAVAMIAVLLAGCATTPGSADRGETADEASLVADARAAAEAGEYRYAVDLLMQSLETTGDPAVARQAAQLASAIDDWPTATIAAARWMVLEPDSQQAAQFATIAALRRQRVDRAVELLQTRLVGQGNPMDWDSAAALLATAGSSDIASAALERLIEQAEGFEPGFDDYLRSRLAWQLEQPQKAFELARQALRTQPDSRRASWAARLARTRSEPELALEYFRLAGEFDPDDRVAAIAEVELLRELGRGEEALNVLARLPQDAEILYTRGMVEHDLGRIAAAGATWQRMASLESVETGLRHAWLTGVLAEILEMRDEAIDWYSRVDGTLKQRADLRRAILLAGRGDLPQARELLTNVRRSQQPEITEQAWLVEGQILAESGNDMQALELLSEALTQLPGSAALLYARAMAAVNQEQMALAEQDLRTIIQSDPDNAIALNALGYTLSDRTDRHREALRLIETALALEPENPAILDSMGWVLFKLGRAEDALPYLRGAVEAQPHPEIVAHLIEVLWRLDRRDEARAWVVRTRDEMAGDAVYAATLQRIGLD